MDGQGIRSLPLEQDYSNTFRTFRPFVGSRFDVRFSQRIIAVPSLSSYFHGRNMRKMGFERF